MYLFRQIRESDVDDVYRLAMEAHSGITSLPKDHGLIKEKIKWTVSSFSLSNPEKSALYFFGLEDMETKKLVGVSAIKTNSQSKYPFNYYKITQDKRPIPEKLRGKLNVTTLLVPIKAPEPFSELCSLFLEKKERHLGLGRLLSLSRFLFIKLNRELFNKKLKASLRGVFDEKDNSPFWEHVGYRYINMSYDVFVDLARDDPRLLLSAIPTTPQTIELMQPEATNVIGLTHKNTQPARHLLEDQGLSFDNEIDLLDGGPILKGEIDTLNPLLNSILTEVSKVIPLETKASAIISNCIAPFQSAMGNAYQDENGIVIDVSIAKILSLDVGSPVLYLKLE